MTRGITLSFVHDLGGARPVGDVIVATTPAAWVQCLDAGLNVTVLDDHADRHEVLPDLVAYNQWLIDWIERIDAAQGSTGAAKVAAMLLRWPTDSLVVRACQVRSVMTAVRPTVVRWVGPGGSPRLNPVRDGHLHFNRMWGDVPLVGQVLPIVASEQGVLAEEIITAAIGLPEGPSSTRRARSFAGRALARRRTFGGIRSPQRGGATLLLWTAGFGIDAIARDEVEAGRRLLLLHRHRGGLVLVEPSGRRLLRRTRRIGAPQLASAEGPSPATSTFLDEVEAWSGPGTSRILRSRFDAFVRQICPEVAALADRLEREFARLEVDRVVCATGSTLHEHAALLAAARRGIDRVMVQHGEQLVSLDSFFTDVESFTEWVSSDPTIAGDMRERNRLYRRRLPRTTFDPVRTRQLRRAVWDGNTSDLVCYVANIPTADAFMAALCVYDDAWYMRWAAQVLGLMKRHRGVSFMWKALSVGNLERPDPVPGMIERLGIRNVQYETRVLRDVLHRVGRVIIDYPSTPVLEAAAVGRPMLVLSFPRFIEVRPSAASLLAPCLVECPDESSALGTIEQFLHDDPSRWTLPWERLEQATRDP